MVEASGIRHDKSWFVQSRTGNIKDEYFFEKKLGSGGYGAVYLAKNKQTGVRVAVKAMQKGKITDYESFQNEITILMNLVSLAQYTAIRSILLDCLWPSHAFLSQTIQHLVCLIQLSFRITPTSSSYMRLGKQTEFASSSQNSVREESCFSSLLRGST
jgi:serine/threonine protein kinase